MSIYGRYILPRIIHCACGSRPTMRQREKVVPLARGVVLELGIGSGHNLPFYDPERVEKVWGVDPSAELGARARVAAQGLPFPVELLLAPGECVPLDSGSVDTVLVTYALCTIPEPLAALAEMARVLKPEGTLIFCEHGAAPDLEVRRWQDRIDPLWQKLSGGCHLNREIPQVLEQGGFRIEALSTMYLPGWRPAGYNFWGTARRS